MVFGRFPLRGSLWSYRHTAHEREGARDWRLYGERLQHGHSGQRTLRSNLKQLVHYRQPQHGSLVPERRSAENREGAGHWRFHWSHLLRTVRSNEWHLDKRGQHQCGALPNTTTLLPDGKVLATGGAEGKYPVSSAELYDPTANTWTYTGNMTIGRYAHTATLLTDGTVLVPGGIGQAISCGKDCTGYIPTGKVDIYSEANGSFTAAASLSQAQAYQSTTLLKTGGALQAGGIGTTGTCCIVLNTAQIYTPLTLTFSASSLNFGLLQIGLTSPPQTVTVTNVSNHSVKFSGIATSGEFSQSHTCPTTLASGQNCTITVTFAPTVAGTQNSAVTLKDNCPGSPVQTISLTGTGETLALGFTPAALNLGSVAVGSSVTQSTTLTNDGAAAVNITGVSISPADGTFTQTNNCPVTLNLQQTCTFQVTFTPPDVFTYNETLSVTNSGGAAATLPLTGTGLDGP